MINTEELQKLLNNTQYKLLNSISSNNSYNNEEYTENIEIIFDSLQNSLKIIKSLQPNDNSNPSSNEIEKREKIIRNLFDEYIEELEIINQKINTGIEVSITDFKEMASDARLIEDYINLSVPKNTSYTQYYNKTRNYLSFLENFNIDYTYHMTGESPNSNMEESTLSNPDNNLFYILCFFAICFLFIEKRPLYQIILTLILCKVLYNMSFEMRNNIIVVIFLLIAVFIYSSSDIDQYIKVMIYLLIVYGFYINMNSTERYIDQLLYDKTRRDNLLQELHNSNFIYKKITVDEDGKTKSKFVKP